MQGPNSLLPTSASNKQTRAFVVGTENCGCWCWRGHRNAVALIGPTHLSSTVVPSDQARAQDTRVFIYLEPDPPSCQAPIDGFPPTKTCFAPKTTTQRAFARLASSTHTATSILAKSGARSCQSPPVGGATTGSPARAVVCDVCSEVRTNFS